MSLKKKLYIFLVLIISIKAQEPCICPTNGDDKFPGITALQDNLQISPDNDENTQGRIIQIGTLFLYEKIFYAIKSIQSLNIKESTDSKSQIKCPPSYQIIEEKDIKTIIAYKDKLKLFKDYIKINIANGEKLIVCSNTKPTPELNSNKQNTDWEFQCVKLDSSLNGEISKLNTFWEKKPIVTFCKKIDSTNVNVQLSGYNKYDLIEGLKYKLSIINNKNVLKYYSEDSQGNKYNSQNIDYVATKTHQYGCSYIKVKILLFGNFIKNQCIIIWVSPQYGSNQDTNLTYSQIKKVRLTGIQSTFSRGLHFTPSSFVLGPLSNENTSWAFYQDNTSKNLMVQKINADGTLNGSSININQQGQPMDITSLPNGGFAILAKNGDKCWLTSYNKSGTQGWNIILHDNGSNPTVVKQQITFLNAQGKQPWGMEIMYKPYNGKLLYARGRIFITWAYYNHFGLYPNGGRNDHTGSSMFSVDYTTGDQRLLYFSFSPSHSLNQELYYDGRFVYFGSLGDAYPQNIKIRQCETYVAKCYGFSDNKDLVNDNGIPSNGTGKAGGRFGGITKKFGINQKWILFQRKEQETISTSLNKLYNPINELSLQLIEPIITDKGIEMNKVNKVQLLTGDLGKRANVIKSVNYGKNILILFSLVSTGGNKTTFNNDQTSDKDDCYIMLINSNDGSKILQETKITDIISANDLMRILQDGRVAYTQVNKDNTVDYFYTPAPIANAQPLIIAQNDPLYGYTTTLLKGQNVFVQQSGQSNQTGQNGQTGQSGQIVQSGQTGQTGQTGQNEQNGQNNVKVSVRTTDTIQKSSSGLIQVLHAGLYFQIGFVCFIF